MIVHAVEYRLEHQVGFKLRKAHQRASEIFGRIMAEHDVTPTQFAALCKLLDAGPLSQNALGRLTAMDPATMSGVVARIKKRGLVRQSADPSDGRAVLLRLTAYGTELTKRLRERGASVSDSILEPLSPAERETFLALLDRLGEP